MISTDLNIIKQGAEPTLQATIENPLKKKVIHPIEVHSENPIQPHFELLSILEDLFPVKFLLSNGQSRENPKEITYETVLDGADRSRLTILLNGNEHPTKMNIQFHDNPKVPFPFRGRLLRTTVAIKSKQLPPNHQETVLASSDKDPLWTLSEEKGVRHFRSALGLPIIPANGTLIDVLNGDHFLELLPLLHWLREICFNTKMQQSPLRACFIFDDPNLHRPSYGFINFREMLKHADQRNYHVSFATIPLDTWFTHRDTASLFIAHADRLSLTVHGNNHTRLELAHNYTQTQRTALLHQALHRITRIERKFGLHIAKIMVPPHGACSEEMLNELPLCGFESACISHGSLRVHNRTKAWTRSLGYHPSELIAGCPILPRWGISGNPNNTILLAAFLGQAIILRGHHQDLRHGIEWLDDLAEFINGLGPVTWSNLTDLSRSNIQWQMECDRLKVPPLGSGTESTLMIKGEPLTVNSTTPKRAVIAIIIRRLLTETRDRYLYFLK